MAYLNEAVRIVRAWPLWKQTILGPSLPEHNYAKKILDKEVQIEDAANKMAASSGESVEYCRFLINRVIDEAKYGVKL